MKIGCVVMASGAGARFGGDKLLASFLGRPLIEWTLDALPERLHTVIVTRSERVRALAGARGCACVLHALPDRRDTIRLGLKQLTDADGCLFCVADQPLLTRDTAQRVIEAFEREPQSIVRAAYQGRAGNPVLFPRALFGELVALAPGETGGAVMRRYPALIRTAEAGFAEELDDIDTREALARLEGTARARLAKEE